jgi:hypothetical protein
VIYNTATEGLIPMILISDYNYQGASGSGKTYSVRLTSGLDSWALGLVDEGGGFEPFAFFTCLITGPDAIGGNESIDDEFSESYSVNGVHTISRKDLCTWTGEGFTMRYSSTSFKWALNGAEKSNPQDSPVGTYGDNTVS